MNVSKVTGVWLQAVSFTQLPQCEGRVCWHLYPPGSLNTHEMFPGHAVPSRFYAGFVSRLLVLFMSQFVFPDINVL